jgi:endonuclease IV
VIFTYIEMAKLIVGVHVSRKSHMLDDDAERVLEDAITLHVKSLGITAVQIFTHGPRTLYRNKIDLEAIAKASSGLNLTAHSPYATVSLWNLDPENLTSSEARSMIGIIANQFDAARTAGAWGVVIHMTLHPPETIAKFTRRILHPLARKYGVTPLLEMVANKSHDTNTYETPEKLNRLSALIRGNYYGWTVDTAHLWAAGEDIASYDAMHTWLSRVKPGMIKQFHLNGSSATQGNGKDKHEIPFCSSDNIFHRYRANPKKSGVYAIVQYAAQHKICIICEINRGSEADTRWCLDVMHGMV